MFSQGEHKTHLSSPKTGVVFLWMLVHMQPVKTLPDLFPKDQPSSKARQGPAVTSFRFLGCSLSLFIVDVHPVAQTWLQEGLGLGLQKIGCRNCY